MRISDWRSDVCSSDLQMDHMRHLVRDHVVEHVFGRKNKAPGEIEVALRVARAPAGAGIAQAEAADAAVDARRLLARPATDLGAGRALQEVLDPARQVLRSEEHTSELQSLMRNSYAVFCLKKQKNQQPTKTYR